MPPPKVKVGLACVVSTAVDELTVALVVIMLFVSIFTLVEALGFTDANAELDGVLATAKKLIDVDGDVVGVVVAANVKVLLLDILVPKFGNELLDVVAVAFGLPKVKVGVVLGVEDTVFCKDSVFAFTGIIDITFA